jgi:hypothetical protein
LLEFLRSGDEAGRAPAPRGGGGLQIPKPKPEGDEGSWEGALQKSEVTGWRRRTWLGSVVVWLLVLVYFNHINT